MAGLNKTESTLIVTFFFLVCLPMLYIGRELDNNSLVRYQWVFADKQFIDVFLLLLPAVFLSWLVSFHINLAKRPVAVLILLSCLAVVPIWDEPELIIDSGRYFSQAKYLSDYGLLSFLQGWGKTFFVWTDLPLIPMLYGLIFKIFGEMRLGIQLLNTLVFSATVLLTYQSARTIFDRQTGFIAGLMMLGSPYLLTQVPLMLVDIHAMFFMVLALYCYLRAIGSGRQWIYISSLAIILAIFVKFSTWAMLPVLPLATLAQFKRDPGKIIRRSLVIFILALLVMYLFVSLNSQLVIDQLNIITFYNKPALKLWQESLVSTFFFQIHPAISLLAIVGLARALWKREFKILLPALFVLLFFLMVKRCRYIIPLIPVLAIVAAHGLSVVRSKEVQHYVSLLIVSMSLVILHSLYLPFFKTTSMANIQEAGAYLNTLPTEQVEVHVLPQKDSTGLTFPAISQLDLFTEKEIVSAQSWPIREKGRSSDSSPLRFTWNQARPVYYKRNPSVEELPLVVISGTFIDDELSRNIRTKDLPSVTKKFTNYSKAFRYKTFITIYHY